MNNFSKKILVLGIIFFSMANLTFAVSFSELALTLSNGIIATISKLAFGFAVVFFLWGIFVFVMNADDATKREEGKKRILWGLVAIFVMVSVWGLLAAVDNTTNLDNTHLDIKFL